ncbi:MAG: DUF885 domain-containing protein [Ardenticatenaceae bacterium]|nr:DUF885 domain-containing protein [Anaerolineales bacterium]MCB8921824.1 DUF885 domain-containing protein [Ardenticatenaceae bacterium]MCB8991018.1 DUF885 domain-containing protein [Ardenticatenaceae bacterium]
MIGKRFSFTLLMGLLLLLVACGGMENAAPSVTPAGVDVREVPTEEVAAATAVPTPTSSPAQPVSPTATPAASQWDGLSLEEFFNQSYYALLLRSPQLVTEAGLVQAFETDNNRLNNLSDDYIRETQALETAVLDQLHTYDRDSLPPDQQLSYDIYEWYLTDLVAGHEFMYNDYPVSFFITSVHQDTLQFFTDIHPITNKQDVEDYIARLSQVGDQFAQLIDGLQRREEAGVVLPRWAINWTMGGINDIARNSPQRTPFYTTLEMKMMPLSSITPEDQAALLAEAEEVIGTAVIPAYQALADTLTAQRAIATDEDGIWKFPNGEAYYNYLLRHYSTTDMTADDIHQLGLQEVERIQAETAVLFAELGYPADESLPELMARVARDGGTLYGDDIVAEYEAIISEAEQNVGPAFDLRPQADVIVIGVPYGGYYVRPAVDGSRPGAFYATYQGSEAVYGMATLAYHEAVPGHHFQLAIMQELQGLPSFRNGISFTAYTEGWALYAEQLAYELGFYEGDAYGNIGRLQAELFRAVRLVVDTGIHTQGWTFDEAVDYMMANTGYPRGMVEGQIARYIVWPGQAVAYKIGMMEILAQRQKAQDALGDAFDLREFHNVVLANGSMPLEILSQVVDEYIRMKGEG